MSQVCIYQPKNLQAKYFDIVPLSHFTPPQPISTSQPLSLMTKYSWHSSWWGSSTTASRRGEATNKGPASKVSSSSSCLAKRTNWCMKPSLPQQNKTRHWDEKRMYVNRLGGRKWMYCISTVYSFKCSCLSLQARLQRRNDRCTSLCHWEICFLAFHI